MPACPCKWETLRRACAALTVVLAGGLLPGGVPAGAQASRAQPDPRPNVVLIIADDLAWDDVGAFGNAAVRTPNLDRLARRGLRFDHAFVTASSCSPSRASLLTGRYPHATDAEQLHWPVPAEQVTFVEHLRAAGYWTGASGKWHLGDAMKSRFDVVDDVGEAGFQTDTTTGKMLATDDSGAHGWVPLLERRPKDQPFFVWLAALDPHRDYVDDAVPDPHDPASVIVPPYLPDVPEVRRDLAGYYDEIARLDDYVGRVLAELEQQGVAEHTVVVFLSDNGRPFPRDKTTLYDSGIRTPLIIRGPDVTSGGTTSSLVSTVDIAPTVLALAGVQPPGTIQGRSFAPILRDPRRSIREEIYAEKNWHDYEDRARAVRTARFKYIRNFHQDVPLTPPADAVRSPSFAALKRVRDAGSLTPAQQRVFEAPRPAEELYDTDADPHELHNLASETTHADTLRALREKLSAWQRETGDAAPSARTPDEFDRETGAPLPARKRPRPGKKDMASARRPPTDEAKLADFKTFADAYRREHKVLSFSYAIVKDGRIVAAEAFGWQDHDAEEPTTPDTTYLAASITKTFTAATLLQMDADGIISLDDDFTTLSDWDGRCRWLASGVTIFGGGQPLDDGYTPPLIRCDARISLRHVLQMRVLGEPGSNFLYHPIVYGRLANWVEEKTGTPFTAWMRRYVLDKAGLRNVAAGWRDPDGGDALRLLAPPFRHAPDESDGLAPSVLPNPELNASSGMIASVRSLAQYSIALDTNRIMPASLKATMWTPPVEADGRPASYSHGWWVQHWHGKKLVWHGGWWPDAYAGFLLKVPEAGLTLVAYGNTDGLHWGNRLQVAEIEKSPLATRFLELFALE